MLPVNEFKGKMSVAALMQRPGTFQASYLNFTFTPARRMRPVLA